MTVLAATALSRPPGLRDATLTLIGGEVVALVGPNGAGKTTLLRALAGLSTGGGSVTLDGTEIGALALPVRARRLAYLPAERLVGWPMRCTDVVALGLAVADESGVHAAMSATDTLMFADRRIDTLSTGERARVLFARAIVGRPDLLLLDEPVSNLDIRHQLDLLARVGSEAKRGAGVLVALHDLDLARRFADRIIVMQDGAIVADAAPDDALTRERLATVFGIARGPDGWARG
jgi:iron complex transport system ATP-binding protein